MGIVEQAGSDGVVAVIALANPNALWGDEGRERLAALDRVWSSAEADVVHSALHAVRLAFATPAAGLAWAEQAFRSVHTLGWGQLRGGMVAGRPEVRRDPVSGRSEWVGPTIVAAGALADSAAPGELVLDPILCRRLPGRAVPIAGGGSVRWDAEQDAGLRLPTWPSAFVGREALIGDLLDALGAWGVVELLGPGGAGKTRAAVRVAERWSASTGRPAVFVSLESSRTAAEVWVSTAQAVGIDLSGVVLDHAVERLVGAARHRGEWLLVLDNAEQVAEPVARLVRSLRAGAPELRVLVTTRVHLGAAASATIGLAGMAPDEALELLRTTSRGAPRWTADDEREAGELAESLDHLPLALVLAAAQLDLLRPGQLTSRLDRLGGSAGRHGSLESTIAWSTALLDPAVRGVLVQLAVFRGLFGPDDVDAVVDVAGGPGFGWQAVRALVDASLIRWVDDRPRFALYEQVRHVVDRWLEEDPARDEVRARHARWAVHGVPGWFDGVGLARLDRVTRVREHLADLLVVLERGWPAAEAAWAAAALDLVARSSVPADVHLGWLELGVAAAEQAQDQALHGLLLLYVGLAEARAGRTSDALARAVVIAERSGDHVLAARVALEQGRRALVVGEVAAATEQYGRAQALAHAAGALGVEAEAAYVMAQLVAYHADRVDEGIEWCHRAVRLHECGGNEVGLGLALAERAALRRLTDDPGGRADLARARTLFERHRHLVGLDAARLREVWFAIAADDEAGAVSCALASLDGARRRNHVELELTCLLVLGQIWASFGHLDRCDRTLVEARTAALVAGRPLKVATADSLRAAVAIERGDLDGADRLLDGVPDRPDTAAWVALWRGIAAALRHDTAAAAACLSRVAPGFDAPLALLVAMETGDAAEVARRLEVPIRDAGDPDLRIGHRIARAAYERWDASGRAALRVAVDGSRLRLPGGGGIDLSRRVPLRRIVVFLADRRHHHPGRPVSLDEVLSAGWPNERLVPRAATNRVYVAVSTLRKLGLKELLTCDDGYLLDPGVEMAWDTG